MVASEPEIQGRVATSHAEVAAELVRRGELATLHTQDVAPRAAGDLLIAGAGKDEV